jgi:RNA-directed DNA polymerase
MNKVKDYILKNLKTILKDKAKENFYDCNEHWSLKYFKIKRKNGKVKFYLNEKGINFLKSLKGKIEKDKFEFHPSSLKPIHKVKPGKRKIPPVDIVISKIINREGEFSRYFRILSTPKPEDYLVEKALFDFLNKKFSKFFHPCSFAFRKFRKNRINSNRATTRAIKKLEELMGDGYKFVTKIDIEKYFDSVDHEIMIKLLRNFLKENGYFLSRKDRQTIIKYVKNFLLSVEKTFSRFSNNYYRKGIFQGHPISCFLANVYLHYFDKKLSEKSFEFVRYADDITILTGTKEEGKKAFKFAKGYLERNLKLKVNEEKSLIGETEFEFLGFKYNSDGSKKIREKSIEKAKNKIRKITSFKNKKYKIERLIREINQFLGYKLESGNNEEEIEKKVKKRLGWYTGKGWIDFFAECSNGKDFDSILSQMRNMDCFTRDRLRSYKYGKTDWDRENIKSDNEEFFNMGLRSFAGTYKMAFKKYQDRKLKILSYKKI